MKSPSAWIVTDPPSLVFLVSAVMTRGPGPSTSLSPLRMSPVIVLFGPVTVGAACVLGCPTAPRAVVYDLAERVPYAERWSAREVILFGTPAAEPQLADGFYREAKPAESCSKACCAT